MNKKYWCILFMVCTIFNVVYCLELKKSVSLDDLNVPCSYHDTVDLSNSHQFQNGSYLYEGILIPEHLVGIYNYHLESLVTRTRAKPHIRGCICLVKTCVKWCCDGRLKYLNNRSCIDSNQTSSTELIIRSNSDENITVDAFDYFFPQMYYLPCDHMYDLNPSEYDYDEWQLFENGSLYRFDDQMFFLKQEYCLAQAPTDENFTDFELKPFICHMANETPTRDIFYAYAMMFSIPFMIITILIYIIIPELRNLHGKSLVCYLTGLVVAYSIFAYLLLTAGKYLSLVKCATLGYIAYFCFMSAFFWLSVISFDLYWNFRGTGRSRSNDTKRFIYFGFYAWGLAALFLGFTIFAQNSKWIPEKYRPGIGSKEYCWLDVQTNFSAVIYFYAPVLCIIFFNIIMFGLTTWKIYHVQREMSKIIAREDSRRNLNTDRDQFSLFLRLFLVMGVTWSAEIVSYFLGESQDSKFYILDFLNLIQGFLIFALFVLKKKIKKLIVKRFNNLFNKSGINRVSRYSTKTTSSNITLTAINTTSPEKPLV